jgi:hypothetical protein
VLQAPSQSSSSGIDPSSLSPHHHYILEQAASILHVSLPVLLDLRHTQDPRNIVERSAALLRVPVSSLVELSRQRNQPNRLNKRPRLNSDAPMPSQYSASPVAQDVSEKSPSSGRPSQSDGDGNRVFTTLPETSSFLGWSQARIAECLANVSFCQPSSGYESDSGMVQSLFGKIVILTSLTRVSSRPHNGPL